VSGGSRVGIRPPTAAFERGTAPLQDFVERVGAAGLDHLCVGDHVSFQDGYGYDGLVQATALAVLSPLPVHTSVYLLPLRHPLPVARQVSSLAQLAPGRVVFGVGLGGDDPHELEVCGIDRTTRGRRMDDCLTIVRALLAGETVDHDGTVVSVHGATVTPAPPVPVPIVVGGRSEAALRRAGRLGDGWLGVFVTPERWNAARTQVEATARELGRVDVTWEHGFSVWVGFGESRDEARPRLAAAMEALYHRPFAEFAKYAPHGTPDDVAAALRAYVAAGCGTFNLIPVAADDRTAIDSCALVRNALRR
jgi:alkanesulfonate monooxygenase SsuD/methylene tetrahydromethanopterin reductase-like flavin-dependent oxidoreductase (luciferase family)